MSSVYRAFDPNLHRKVAIKIIHQHLSDNADFIRRFEQEAAVVAQLRHNNIVQVHDFNHEGDVYYMVMEFVPGETLSKKLEGLKLAGIRMPLAETVRIMTIVCNAVDYAHQRRMIHRDLKPANVMLNLLNEPILMDFGIAKIVGGRSHTITGAAMGTAAYMAPEQVHGVKTDHRSDIYSLGIMLYEMLSGEPPYQGESTYQIMLKHVNEPLPDIQLVEANTPNSLVAILEKALAKNPDDRYQTAAEMGTALSTVGLQLQGPTDTLAARHLDHLAVLWRHANDLFDEREYAACIDKLDELKRADDDYQAQKVAQLRQKAVERLHEQARRALTNQDYGSGLTAVTALQARASDLSDLDEMESAMRTGLKKQAVLTQLNQLYETAVTALENRDYRAALATWQNIQAHNSDVEFPDRLAVERRAQEGICASLYTEAVQTLAQNEPKRALELWQEVTAIDANYPDTQQVASRAQALLAKQQQKRWAGFRRPALLIGIGALVLVLLFTVFGNRNDDGDRAAATPTRTAALAGIPETSAPVPTDTPAPTATETAVPTRTPTATATPSPTATITATPNLETATARENASVYRAPDSSSTEIAIVMAEESVRVLARSQTGNWLYVRSEAGEEGFAFLDFFNWPGDIENLPVQTSSASVNDNRIGNPTGAVSMEIYPLTGMHTCDGDNWTQSIFIRGRGGNGEYTYYWQGENVGTAVNDSITFDVSHTGGSYIGMAEVVTSDGDSASQELFIPRPDCSE